MTEPNPSPSWWPKQGPTEFIRDDSDDGAALVRAFDANEEALVFCVQRINDLNLAETGMSRDGVQALARAAVVAMRGADEDYEPS